MLKERRTHRIRPAAIVLLAAATLTAAGCGRGHARGKDAQALSVTVSTATRGSVINYASLDGQVQPLQQSTLSSNVQGPVAAVYVNEGARVHRGDLLAKIDDAVLRTQLAQAEAQLAQARAKYAGSTLQNPLQEQTSNAAVLNAQQSLLQAKNSLVAAHASNDVAQSTFQSDRQLFAQGYLSRTDLDKARSAAVSAEQQLNSAESSLRQAQENLASARKGTLQIDVQKANTQADRANMESMAAQVDFYRAQIRQTSIVAPFDGYVTARKVDPGTLAVPGTVLLTVSQLDQVWVDVPVPSSDLAYVRQGTPVQFMPILAPAEVYHAVITDVNRTPTQGTLSYRARIRLANDGARLRGGELVRVRLMAAAARGVVVVPRAAVFRGEAGDQVFIVRSEQAAKEGGGAPALKARIVPVKVGVENDELAAVTSPAVSPGTRVIVSRPDALQDGSRVAVAGAAGE
ncbi:MAG: efflux RND transporter periplasmic adaptor subunit [bacterium]|nr:efflux RND transporter periplasmic adaptor subunit [bacterium]